MLSKIITVLFIVIGSFYIQTSLTSNETNEADAELWVMIETNEYFRSQPELEIENEVITIIESMELGEFDGHSSGAHQFDFNFINIQDFNKSKNAINDLFKSKYPKLNYVISSTYKTTFDKVN